MENSVNDIVHWVEAFEDATQDSRLEAEKCRDYYDGKQWTDEEVAELQKRKQAAIVINRIKPKVDFLIGMERENRTDPKAFPRNYGQDEKAAEAVTDAIRYVCDANDFDVRSSECYENLLVEGTEGAEVIVKPKGKGYEIEIKRFRWDRLFYDHHSREKDFSDAKYLGGVLWMDKDDALEMFPGKENIIEQAYSRAASSETLDDKPSYWVDTGRKRVRIGLCYWKKKGKWHFAWFCYGGFLKGPALSPYVDEDGEPVCALILQSAYVDREGNRYGAVRQLLDLQDEINKRRSKALHLLSVRQTFGRQDAIPDVRKMKLELAKPDGHIETTYGDFGKDFGVLPTGDMAAAQFQLLQEAKGEIDAQGANASLTGKDERDLSGRALLARQSGGLKELGAVFDAHAAWKKRIYRAIWHRIRQFWTEERWIRVTENEKAMQWVGLNQTVTAGDMLMEQYGEQAMAQFANDPRLSQVVAKRNDVTKLYMDIMVEEVPDMVNMQAEQFQMLTQMYNANPEAIPFDMVIEASSLRNKEKLLDKLRGESPEAQQAQQAQMQARQKAQQLLEAGQAAKIEKDLASAEKARADAENTKADMMKTLSEIPQTEVMQ